MKKFILITLLSITPLLGEYFSIEGNTSFFYPQSPRLRDVYTDIFYQTQVRLTGHFADNFLGQSLGVMASSSYLQKHGNSINVGIPVKFIMIPTSLGALFSFPMGKLEPFVGSGLRYYYLKEKSSNTSVDRNGLGGYFEIGSRIRFNRYFYMQFIADYGIKEFSTKRLGQFALKHGINVGGLSVGGGIGFSY